MLHPFFSSFKESNRKNWWRCPATRSNKKSNSWCCVGLTFARFLSVIFGSFFSVLCLYGSMQWTPFITVLILIKQTLIPIKMKIKGAHYFIRTAKATERNCAKVYRVRQCNFHQSPPIMNFQVQLFIIFFSENVC